MKNTFHKGSKYLHWGITAFCVIACGVLFYFALDYVGVLFKALGTLVGILSPFIWGLVISYLLLPLTNLYERKWFRPLTKKIYTKQPGPRKGKKFARTMSVLLSEITMMLVIAGIVYLIIPQLVESIKEIAVNSPGYIQSAYDMVDKLLQNNPEIEKYATSVFGNLNETLTNWAQNTLLPGVENILTGITTGVYYALKALYNIIIGIIVSFYVLYNHESFRAHSIKLLYSMASKEKAKGILKAIEFTDDTFMGFIKGKLLDSAIIGVMCYFGCLILKMPYAPLVAVIVGVTNVIPFFGPFIGAIPSALLILLVDPFKCLIFIIFVIALQQFDGNILGPKILGSTIGINGFWVMFSIVVGAGLFGFWGMLLGVPVFVIIYTGISNLVDRKLRKNDISTDTNKYRNVDYIDPESGKFVLCSREEMLSRGLDLDDESEDEEKPQDPPKA